MQFDEFFWGERNNGFDVLLNNLKHGADSSKEIFDFLKESCTIEDVYAKQLSRLAKSCSTYSSKGSFGPMWVPVRTLCEKLSNLHQQLVLTWNELMREVHKYSEQRLKQHKQVKEEESATQEAVQAFQQTVQLLQKAKETYYARCSEREKLKRESGSLKDLEKAEARCKKAGEDYRHIIEKYATARNEFETKMVESCKKFHGYEEAHLKQMKDFIDKYAKTWGHQHVVLGQMHEEFRIVTEELSVEKLMEKFVTKKTTGQERPGSILFEEFDPTTVVLHAKTPDADKLFATTIAERTKQETGERDSPLPNTQNASAPPVTTRTANSTSLLERTIPLRTSAPWLFPGRKKKAKKLEKGDGTGSEGTKTPVAEIDDEGYTIRPADTPGPDDSADKDSSASSEDEESLDSHGRSQKLKVEIKPANANDLVSPTSNSDLLNMALSLRLSPTLISGRRSTPPVDLRMRKSQSVSETLTSSQLRPYEIDLYSSVSSEQPNSLSTTKTAPTDSSTQQSTMEAAINSSANNSASSNDVTAVSPPYKWLNPITQRTLDDIPVAIMIKETVNAHFNHQTVDSAGCRLRVTGEVVMAFPACMFDDTSPASYPLLAFRLNGTQCLDFVLHDDKVVSEYSENTYQSESSYQEYVVDVMAIKERNNSSSSTEAVKFVTVNLLKYQVLKEHSGEPPLYLSSSWRSNGMRQEYNLSYACHRSRSLSDVKVMVKVSDARNHFFSSMISDNKTNTLDMKATPEGEWLPTQEMAVWKLGSLENGASNDINASFSSLRPLSEQTALWFTSNGVTFVRGVDCQLTTPGYRLAQCKKCFVAGKYTVESTKK